jgi:hypothetical protein
VRICSPSCLSRKTHAPYFIVTIYTFVQHYLMNGTIFLGKELLNTKCTTSVCNIYCPGTHLARYDHKCVLVLFDFNENLIFSTDFQKKTPQISNFVKIRPVGAELSHADGRTDRHDEANRRCWQFCERARKVLKNLKFITEDVASKFNCHNQQVTINIGRTED